MGFKWYNIGMKFLNSKKLLIGFGIFLLLGMFGALLEETTNEPSTEPQTQITQSTRNNEEHPSSDKQNYSETTSHIPLETRMKIFEESSLRYDQVYEKSDIELPPVNSQMSAEQYNDFIMQQEEEIEKELTKVDQDIIDRYSLSEEEYNLIIAEGSSRGW